MYEQKNWCSKLIDSGDPIENSLNYRNSRTSSNHLWLDRLILPDPIPLPASMIAGFSYR